MSNEKLVIPVYREEWEKGAPGGIYVSTHAARLYQENADNVAEYEFICKIEEFPVYETFLSEAEAPPADSDEIQLSPTPLEVLPRPTSFKDDLIETLQAIAELNLNNNTSVQRKESS